MTIETANRLCTYRKHFGLSQEELAEKVGVSRQAVSKWERAEASPDTDNLILLSKIYGVTLDELLYKDPPEDTEEEIETEEEPIPEDKVSFKNGIHVHSKNGDKVDISLSGINVVEHSGDRVHVGFDGIHVEEDGHIHVTTDKDGNLICESDTPGWYRMWKHFPYPILCVLAFLLAGFFDVSGGWSICWLVFLTIPLFYSLGTSIYKRNPKHFCYPVLAVLIFFLCGFFLGCWHPAWIVFLTIPVYYWICKFFK